MAPMPIVRGSCSSFRICSAMRSSSARQAIASPSRAARAATQALIEISDTGPGIAADDLPHIFDPYYSASGKHQKTGTGLGLYISKGIVDAHGGQIRCSSKPGAGTTFSITLPLTAEPAQVPAAS